MIYYTYVQRPGEPLFRQPILAFQRKKKVVGDVELPEEASLLEPDANGIFSVNEKHEYIKQIRGSIEKVMGQLNRAGQAKRLIGPFEDDDPTKVKQPLTGYQKALLAACQERPKTADEQVAIKDAEIAELKKKLEAKENPGDGK